MGRRIKNAVRGFNCAKTFSFGCFLSLNAVETRERRGGDGGGARKAMEKSVTPEGEEGVTMMAGSSAFSSTMGKVRSEKSSCVSSARDATDAVRRTQWRGDQRIVQPLRKSMCS